MRIDKFLKVSRIIKRRTVAQEACDGNRIEINGKTAKPSKEIKVGDVVKVAFGDKGLTFKSRFHRRETRKQKPDGIV